MTTVNKTSLIQSLETLIGNLTLSTIQKTRLVRLLKTTDNLQSNASEIITQLQTDLNNISGSTDVETILVLILALTLITNDRMVSVASFSNLPATAPVGSIFYIVDQQAPVIKNSSGWIYLKESKMDTVWAWGFNSLGRLGDGTVVSRSSPVSVVGGYTDWIQVSASSGHSLGLRANGTAWAWGLGTDGRLGDGTVVAKSSPVSVIGGFTDWIQISCGFSHSVGLRANGTAWAWGLGTDGSLGDGTAVNKSSPVSVIGGFTDWIQVSGSSGGFHSLGLRANGTAWAWGLGTSGQLGDDTIVNKSSPVSIVGGYTDWIQVSGASLHSLGLRANGTAWAWGLGTLGRLGDNTLVNKSSPVSVVGGFTDWIQVDGGSDHSLGVRANGTAWAWGRAADGRLGNGTVVTRSSPVSVVGGFTDWIQVSGGTDHSLGLRANGTTWAWGSGDVGRLGDGTVVNKSSPVSVVGGFTDWIQVDAGNFHNLGLRAGK